RRNGANGVERQRSLEHRLNRPKSREKDPKRPSTAEGFASRSVEQTGSFHHSSQSESGLLLSPPNQLFAFEPSEVSDKEMEREHVPSKSDNLLVSPPRRVPSPVPPIRSRTPVLDTSEEYSSRIADKDTELGPDLFRVSTAPLRGASAKTASKLTRMGFPPLEQARTPPTNPKGLGAIRSFFVQTLKGRT
ncbi:Ankyrin-2, partial [Termitomyces sp. T112]